MVCSHQPLVTARVWREQSRGALPLKGLANFQGDHQVLLTREEGRLLPCRTFLPVASSDCALSEALNRTSSIPHSQQGDRAGQLQSWLRGLSPLGMNGAECCDHPRSQRAGPAPPLGPLLCLGSCPGEDSELLSVGAPPARSLVTRRERQGASRQSRGHTSRVARENRGHPVQSEFWINTK